MVYKNLLILFTVFLLNGQALTAAAKKRALNKRKKTEVAEVSHIKQHKFDFDDTALGDFNEDDLAVAIRAGLVNEIGFQWKKQKSEYLNRRCDEIERLMREKGMTGEQAYYMTAKRRIKPGSLPNRNFYPYMSKEKQDLMNQRSTELRRNKKLAEKAVKQDKKSVKPVVEKITLYQRIEKLMKEKGIDGHQAWRECSGYKYKEGALPGFKLYNLMPKYIKNLMNKRVVLTRGIAKQKKAIN